MYKVGLTGLLGSGKSQAASYFAELGIDIIDTDLISHHLTKPSGAAIPMIISNFGIDYICSDGGLNRSKMRELIFKDDCARVILESILHPLIFNEVIQHIAQKVGLYVVIVIPLLFKSQLYLEIMDRTIFVDCDEDRLISRVMLRNGFTEYSVRNILSVQLPRSIQLGMADDILDNNKDLQSLRAQVLDLDKKYNSLFA
jgi:dephospho-CoA kinase